MISLLRKPDAVYGAMEKAPFRVRMKNENRAAIIETKK